MVRTDWSSFDWDKLEEQPTRLPVSVPEPASMGLLVMGLLGLGVAGKRKRDQ